MPIRLLLSVVVVAPLLICAVSASASEDQATAEAPNVRVTHQGIDAAQAQAVADTLSAARVVYVERFGFEMPETVLATVRCGKGEVTRLYTDGNDRVFLSMPSKRGLAKPAVSGVWNLYGMCHELGHVAMYRVLRDRDWMTTAAAEGWAHFAGSVVVDEVYKAKGPKLWSADPYDYRADGTARLTAQLHAAKPSDVARGAGLWQDLDGIIGPQSFPKLFAAWQEAKIDPSDPATAMWGVLEQLHPQQREPLDAWWKKASPLFVERREKSGFDKVELPANRLAGKPLKLAGDDDKPDGKRSTAGGGHARLFDAPGDGWYVRAIWLHGGRYGPPQPPKTDFDLVLCDAELNAIATWKFPYKTFGYGTPRWVRIEVPPTLAPPRFAACAVFRPTATSGVYVSFDSATTGNSFTGTPGKPGGKLPAGDWMIRIELDRPKDADSLGGK